MTPKRIAFLSMANLEGYFTYDELPAAVLRARGHQVDFVPWRDSIDWDRYDIVVIRSTWDYQSAPEEFLAVLRVIESSTAKLLNPLPVVQANIRKTYLLDLDRRGVPTVPTRLGRGLTRESLRLLSAEFGVDELVIKPTVGANASGAFRLKAPFQDTVTEAALAAYADAEFLAQPFLQSIVDEGEISLMYFLDQLSHAIIKWPKSGDFRVQEEHGGNYKRITPAPDVIAVGARVMEALPRGLLYARIDLARRPDGAWGLMEAELIEPSLYFDPDDAGDLAPGRFADAIESLLQ